MIIKESKPICALNRFAEQLQVKVSASDGNGGEFEKGIFN
jgi:hypothetical protein